jgi:tetratricopeptide (TPR) repeat protein
MGTIGRNDPCPCGSGKKYKKCCLTKGRKSDQEAVSTGSMNPVVSWVLNEPYLKNTFELITKKYMDEKVNDEIRFNQLVDAFIFDYTIPHINITPFQFFLKKAGLSPQLYPVYQRYEKNVFSIFKIIDIQYDKGMMLQDLVWTETYWITEKKGTHMTNVGDVVFCRIAPFQDGFISLSPAINKWPPEASYLIERGFRGVHTHEEGRPINAFDIFEIIYCSKEKTKDLTEIKKVLKKKLIKLGLKIDFRSLDTRINEHTNIYDAFPEIQDFNFPSNKDFRETMDLVLLLWNTYPRREFKGKTPQQTFKIGPRENMLVQDLINEAMREINPDTYPSSVDAEAAAKKYQKIWLEKPQKELGGKTPIEVILKEREMLGNPDKKFNMQIELIGVKDYDSNLAEKLYFEGVDAFNEGAVGLAAERFEQVTQMYPENYKAWGNLGNSLAYLGVKEKAIRCYKKALEINPEYEFAKKNLASIKDMPEEVLGLQGMLGAFKGAIHIGFGKKRTKTTEKFNVWDEIDKDLKKEQEKDKDQ